MPEMMFAVRWPDGHIETCYSPSSIIATFFEKGRPYRVDEFVTVCRQGFEAANARVAEVYGGSGCARARAQLAIIEAEAQRHINTEGATVRIESLAHRVRKRA